MNSVQLRSFFYGTLLGDSYIHNNVFYCAQISEDLIRFKYNIIKNHLPSVKIKVEEHPERIDKNGVRHQKFWMLSVSKSEYIKKLYQYFYPEGKKICPKGSIEKLDALGLAMWYADDGTTILLGKTKDYAKSRRLQLCTDGFDKNAHENIIIPELEKLGLVPTLVYRNNLCRINLKDMKANQKFLIDIGHYFYNYFPSLLYKMDMGYRGATLDNEKWVSPQYKDFYTKMSAHPMFIDRMI